MASRVSCPAMAVRVPRPTMPSRVSCPAMAVRVPRPTLEASPVSLPCTSLQGAHPPSPVLLLRRVRSTVHIPEPSQTHCTHLWVFPTSDIPVSPPLQPIHVSPARKQRTVTASSAIWLQPHCALLTSRHLLVISSVSFNKYPCFDHLPLCLLFCIVTISWYLF